MLPTNKIFLLIFLLCLCSSACNRKVDETQQESILNLNETLLINGSMREYHIQFPKDHNNKALVILLHGHGGSADQSIGESLTKAPQKVWLSLAEENQFIVAVPNGELGPEGTRGWNDCRTDAPTNPTTDDVVFIYDLIQKIKEDYNHNSNRVYIAGVSNGGSMAFRLSQEIPEKITAFASVVSSIPENSICLENGDAISALYMNGTMDPIAPYEGGEIEGNRGLIKSTNESIKYWIERNQTDTFAQIEIFDDLDPNDNSIVERSIYNNGINNTQVALYKIVGGGHTEPSKNEEYSQIYLNFAGEQNHDIEMAEEIWNFFKDKSK